MKVIVYGEISVAEKDTFRYRVQRNAVNEGFIEGCQMPYYGEQR